MGIWIPEEYGGHGRRRPRPVPGRRGALPRLRRGRASPTRSTPSARFPIILGGTEEQKQKCLPADRRAARSSSPSGCRRRRRAPTPARCARARCTTATAGSSTATRSGPPTANAASIYTVYASTDPERGTRGISAFIVEKGTPGFEIGKREDSMGIRCVPVHELHFRDCRVPASALLGGEGGRRLRATR